EDAVDGVDFSRLDQSRVCNRHGMKDSVERLPPEGQKPLQFREFRTEVVFLPDIGLEQPGMIRTPVEDVRGRQAVALNRTAEATALHLVLQSAETQTLRHRTGRFQAHKVNKLF